jgi:hypothetical protein
VLTAKEPKRDDKSEERHVGVHDGDPTPEACRAVQLLAGPLRLAADDVLATAWALSAGVPLTYWR